MWRDQEKGNKKRMRHAFPKAPNSQNIKKTAAVTLVLIICSIHGSLIKHAHLMIITLIDLSRNNIITTGLNRECAKLDLATHAHTHTHRLTQKLLACPLSSHKRPAAYRVSFANQTKPTTARTQARHETRHISGGSTPLRSAFVDLSNERPQQRTRTEAGQGKAGQVD